MLTVKKPALGLGDELRIQLAFKNESGQAAVVVPPLDGSWRGARQPVYELVFTDSKGRPLPNALGFVDNTADCGLVNPVEPGDRRTVRARGSLDIDEAGAYKWGSPLRVLNHAHPGTVNVRLRYRADRLPGATPLDLISNAVELTIRGGNEALWACRNAQVERAAWHDYAENSPSRLVARDSEYLLVYQRTTTRVRPTETRSTGAILVQRLGSKGEPLGDPIEIARSDTDSLGLVRTLEVSGGLLVAFTTSRGEVDRSVHVVHVDTSQPAPRADPMTTISKEPGEPFYLALARAPSADRAAIVWRGRQGKSDVLRFMPLDGQGKPTGSAVSLASSAGLREGELLLEPSGSDLLLAWHQRDEEVRLQRFSPDGAPRGSAASVQLAAAGATMMTLEPRADRTGLVYADNSLNHQVPGDTMGLHETELSSIDFSVISDAPASPWDSNTARFGAAAFVSGRLARIWTESRILFFASAPGAAAPRITLSTTAGGTHGLWPTTDKGRILATWTDTRDDDQRRCVTSSCVSEAYVAVLDPTGKILVPPSRATRSAIAKAVPLHQANWDVFCASGAR